MRSTLLATSIIALSVASHAHAAGSPSDATHQHAAVATEATKLDSTRAALRDLWLGHVFWVRNVVTSAIAGNGAEEKAAETQVVANAQSIAAAIEPFYGAAAKEKLFGLLAGHYGAVKAYLEATVAKNAAKQSAATDALLANADDLATFLSGANPNLPKDAVLGLLQEHGGHHIAQIKQLAAKDYAGEAQTWSAMTKHMYVIADALGGAIAKQFPEKFAAK